MPISRSTTLRDNSRSPAPPPIPNPSTPRPFLPPVHYDVASGYTTRHLKNDMGHPSTSNIKNRPKEEVKRNHSRGLAGVQAPPEASNSESSLKSATEEWSPQSNAQKRRSGFPDIEAQLLPSLRDTIDRMTLAPSRASTPFKTRSPSESARENHTQKRRSSPDLRTPTSRKGTRHPDSRELTKYNIGDGEPLTPNPSNFYSNESTPTLGNYSSKLKTPAKSALKNSLRSPASTMGPRLPSSPAASAHSTTAGSSLRTVKSLLSRKVSGSFRSPFNGSRASREAKKNEEDLPTPRIGAYLPTANPEITPVAESLNFPSVKNFQSNIPRARTRFYNSDPPSGPVVEDSDLEHRYETESRDRRKLTVTNAKISISGSSSESDAEIRQQAGLQKMNAGRPSRNISRIPVGLGLSLSHPSAMRSDKHDIQSRRTDHRSPQEKNLRFSLPVSESTESAYSDEFNNIRPDSFRKNHDVRDQSREREETLETTLVLPPSPVERRRTPNSKRPTSPRTTISCRLSPSPVYPVDHAADEANASGHESYHLQYTSKSKRRSSSCEPKFTASPERDSDSSFVPIVPQRPRSACQRYAPPSPRNSEVFPANLRDLIKSRQSFHSSSPDQPGLSRRTKENVLNRRSGRQERIVQHAMSPPYSEDDGYRKLSFDRDQTLTEASAIAQGYRSAAARERMAFGLPPSESDEVFSDREEDLSQAESNLSSLNESLWQENSEELSMEAESILRSLNYPSKEISKKKQRRPHSNPPRLSVISPTLSASSSREEPKTDMNWNANETPGSAGRSTSISTDCIPTKRFDPLPPSSDIPNTREAVIQEIFETEEELLRLFHICMRVFILPLRVQNSRSWIEGVPLNIARLLDWFDDIVNLHEQIYESLCSARDTMSPATDRVSESIRCFVLKVEIYQPYLVRLADVSQEIASLMANPKSDFGQFITIQQRSPECEGWSFERLLMLPVNRLAAYQDLFSRMLDLTPKIHQDYLSTFSLSRSTDTVIGVMTEVKIREDEYKLLKTFASRVQGLSASHDLATRERRLLHSGPLALVLSDNDNLLQSQADTNATSQQKNEARRSKRTSKFLDAVSISSFVFERSDSVKSASTSSSSTTGPVMTSTPIKSSWFSRLPLGRKARSKSPLPVDPLPQASHSPPHVPQNPRRTVNIHAFVFNDLVLLAQPSQVFGDEPHWILLGDLGVFKPLSIAEIHNKNPQEEAVVSLEALVLEPEDLNKPLDFRASTFRVVDLILPHLTGNSGSEVLQDWLLAFRQCSQTTLRKLTFIGIGHQDGGLLSECSDRTMDTHLALASLVGSGLPIPRSPSGTFPDTLEESGGFKPGLGDEREERGWWSLRYQQVFREFQRQDSLLSDEEVV